MSRTIRAAAAVCAMSAAGAAQANTFSSFTNGNNYNWRVTYMPDYDQKRSGLPGNGSMYCVPTATLNMAGYVARHGYPFVGPGPIYFPANNAQYNTITANINVLGVLMGTDADDGTGGTGWFNGAQAWFHPAFFEVQKKYASGGWSPKTYNIFQYGQQGGLTAFAYGRYEATGNFLTDRVGGHAVTTSKVDVVNGQKEIWFRNPSSSGSLSTQAAYVHQKHDVLDQVFTTTSAVRTMTELLTDATDGIRRIIDGVVVVYPRFGMTNNDPNSLILNLPLSIHNPTHAPPPQTFHFAQNFSDFDMDPLRESIIAVLIGVAGGPPSQVVQVDPVTGVQSPLGGLNFAGRMVISRRGLVYVYERGNLVCMDRHASGIAGPLRKPYPPDFEPVAIAVDDATDTIYLVGDGSVILAIPDDLQGDFIPRTIVGQLPTGDVDACISPVDGSLWVSSTGLDRIQQYVLDANGNFLPAVQITDGTSVVNPRSVQVDDMGDVFFSSSGLLQHWTPTPVVRGAEGGGYEPAQDSIWAGMPAGTRLVMSRSRDNYDPDTMSGPSFNNVLPEGEQGIGEEVGDCSGDVNFNGVIDFEDLNLVLANINTNEAWLDGDVDGDGDVDFADLNFVLSGFNTDCD